MEVIKKKICIEDFISRTPIPTSNLPVVNTGVTNSWGEIPSRLIHYKGKDIKYHTFINHYKQLEELVKKSTYFRCKRYTDTIEWVEEECVWNDIKDNKSFKGYYNNFPDNSDDNSIIGITSIELVNESTITTSIGDIPVTEVINELKEINLFLNKNYVPSDIEGVFVPSYVYYAQKDSILNLLNSIKPSENNENCCNLNRYNKYGGDEFYKWVSGLTVTTSDNISASTSVVTNIIDIPILLTSKINELGQYKTYDVILESGDTEVEITTSGVTSVVPRLIETSGESKLRTLRKRKKNYDDLGNELPDMLWYNASSSINLEIGYVTGYIKNIQTVGDNFYGDLITNIESSDTEVTFTYVLGGKLNKNCTGINDGEEDDLFSKSGSTYRYNVGDTGLTSCGIWYQETFPIIIGTTTCNINNSGITINYAAIDFNSKETILEYNGIDFPRKNYILCEKIRYISDSYISSGSTTNHFIFKDEKMLNLNFPLKEDYDVIVDRGMSSAFERHLQLGEVKTWQDLENYRNGSLLNK